MNLSLEKKNFIEAVQKTARFAQRSSATLPILSCILIVSGDDGIKFRATNLEVGIDFKVAGTSKELGVVAIPAHLLQQLAGSLSGEGAVTLEQTGDVVVVTAGGAKSVIKTVPYEDFPSIPLTTSSEHSFTIAGSTFKNAIEAVVACASTSTVRPDLASIFFSIEGGMLTTVATDSFRLAEKKQSLPQTTPTVSMLIPAKNSLDIVQTIPDDTVTVAADEHQLVCSWNGSTLTSRLTTGSYPDYRQIIPKENASEATLLRKDFESALRHTTIFSDAFQKVRMGFDQKDNALKLSSRNADIGESEESIPARVFGNPMEFSFNHRYLQTPLSLITTESISLTASGIGRPLIMRGVGDSSFLYLVMPMNQ
ncbi:MAG TPA: DNA polymerase III subunit beta [Candidatus Paceibacterota bacterium]